MGQTLCKNAPEDGVDASFLTFDNIFDHSTKMSGLKELIQSEPEQTEFVFLDTSRLGDHFEDVIRSNLEDLSDSKDALLGFCPHTQQGKNILGFPRIVEVLEEHKHVRNVVFFGAAKFAGLKKAEGRAKSSLSDILKHLDNRKGGRLFFTFDGKTQSQACKIFDFLYNSLKENNRLSDVSFNRISVVGYADIFSRVRETCLDREDPEVLSPMEEIANNYASEVFQLTFNMLNQTLEEAHESKKVVLQFRSLHEQQKETICPHLVKGIIHGGSRANDRPWGFEKLVEETRQRLLSALVREMVPVFHKGSNVHVDDYIAENITPNIDKFSLPASSLLRISPAATDAKYRS